MLQAGTGLRGGHDVSDYVISMAFPSKSLRPAGWMLKITYKRLITQQEDSKKCKLAIDNLYYIHDLRSLFFHLLLRQSCLKETEGVIVLPPPVLESYSSLSMPREDLVCCFLIGEPPTFLS